MSHQPEYHDSNSGSGDHLQAGQQQDPNLLSQVLQETLARGGTGLKAAEWEAFRQIAKSPDNRDRSINEVSLLLVECFLTTRFPKMTGQRSLEPMCQRISESLCGDPVSMQRMKTFWGQLQESVL